MSNVGDLAPFPGIYRDISTPQCSIQDAKGLDQELCLGVQISYNLNNGNLLLVQEIMLLKINVLGLEEGVIIRFIRDLPPEFCKTCAAHF